MKKGKQKFNPHLVMKPKFILQKQPEELDSLTETFKLRFEAEDNEKDTKTLKNLFGEKMDHLIVIDDVSGVADISKKSANFSRNYFKKTW